MSSQAIVVATGLNSWVAKLDLVLPELPQHVAISRKVEGESIQRSRRKIAESPRLAERILSEPTWWRCLILVGLGDAVDVRFKVLHLLKFERHQDDFQYASSYEFDLRNECGRPTCSDSSGCNSRKLLHRHRSRLH